MVTLPLFLNSPCHFKLTPYESLYRWGPEHAVLMYCFQAFVLWAQGTRRSEAESIKAALKGLLGEKETCKSHITSKLRVWSILEATMQETLRLDRKALILYS